MWCDCYFFTLHYSCLQFNAVVDNFHIMYTNKSTQQFHVVVYVVRYNCLQYGAAVNEVTEEGYTPLHVAAKEGHVEICEILLDSDASVDVKSKVSIIFVRICLRSI